MNPFKFIHTLNETEPEMARREYITRNLLFFLFSVTFSFSLILFILYLFGKIPLDTLLINSALSLMLLMAMFLTAAGFWRLAGMIPPLLMYFPAISGNYIGGIDAPGNFMYALFIILIAFIYGHRKMWIALVICLATYLSLVWMISNGFIKPYRTTEMVFANRVVLTSGFLVSIALMIWLLARSYESEIKERIKTEELLNKKNQELGTLNEALRESEEIYTKLIATMPDVMVRTDLHGEILFINDVGLQLGNYERHEMIGRNMLSFIAPDDQDKAAQNTLIMFDKKLGPKEYHLMTKDGGKLLFEVNGDVLRNENGSPYGIVHICRNITDRKQAESALRESEGKYRTIIEQMEDGYFEVDLAGNFTFVNDAESRILGYSRDELIGMNNRQYQNKTSAKKAYLLFRKVYQTGAPFKALDSEIIRQNGTRGFHEVSVSLIRDTEGRPIGFRGISRDVTERMQAEEERQKLVERLNRAEKMEALGQLAGGVAHDLNNVLGVLTGYSELLLMEIPEGQRARSHVEKIMQSTGKGAAIIQDLLTLARRGVASSDVANLNQVVSDFLKAPVFENLKDYHPRVTFRTEYDHNLLNIKGSPVHLEKTLMNLVSNAAESITGEGEVTIRTESRYLDKAIMGYDEVKEGDYAILTVSDTGMGISAENREKIFEPFYTKKTMGRSGTGLGLSIVWGTVKDHNGYIDVQTRIGEGTTFTLYFPVTREELAIPQQKESIEQYLGKGESVLVIDDVAEQRDVASGLLTRLGYKVHAVASGEAAVEYLKGNKADILVLDMIMLPGIDGLTTYQRVLEINPQQKAILVSGFSETDRVREAQRLGAGAYVKKPYVMGQIGMAIRDELNR